MLALFSELAKDYPSDQCDSFLSEATTLAEGVSVGPYAVIGRDVEVGKNVVVGAHTVVGDGCTVGEATTLHPHVVLYAGSTLGQRVIVHSGARIGVDGFGYVYQDGEHQKVPQVHR